MTSRQARTVTDVVLVSAAVAAGYVIITTPSLRRFALRATRLWLGASLPAYLIAEARRAWVESGRMA